MWGIILDNARGFGVGVVVGFIISRMLVRMEKAAVVEREAHQHVEISVQPRHARLQRQTMRFMLGFLVSVALFLTGTYTGFKVLEHKYTCLDTYANDLYDSLTPRQTATQSLQDRQSAINTAITGLFGTAHGTPAEQQAAKRALKQALDDYNTADTELTNARLENPYPDPPREVC